MHRLYIGTAIPGQSTVWPVEAVEHEAVRLAGEEGIQGLTIMRAVGVWRGHREATVVVEIAAVRDDPAPSALARRLARELSQDCVMHTYHEGTVAFVSSGEG